MSHRLSKKTILITGASSGIGRATALEFAHTAPDCRLILTARREPALAELKSAIEKESPAVLVLVYKLDVSNLSEVEGIVEKLPPGWREVDVLVNNAYLLPLPTHCYYHPTVEKVKSNKIDRIIITAGYAKARTTLGPSLLPTLPS